MKFIVSALVCGILLGIYAAFSAYKAGWLPDVWLLGFAVQGAVGASLGLATHLLGHVAVVRLQAWPLAAFIGSGVLIMFGSSLVSSSFSSGETLRFAQFVSVCALGIVFGLIAYGAHAMPSNYVVKPTAGRGFDVY